MTASSSVIGPAAKAAQSHNRPDTRGYEAARDVNARAAAAGSADAPHARKAIDRINKLLDAGVPLKRDVPRGYYLDIKA